MKRKRSEAWTSKSIGLKIRAARLSVGWSQMKLAEKIGVTYQQLQKYESGVSQLTVRRLRQFCDILGLPFGYFLEDEIHHKTSESKMLYGELSKDELKLVQLLRKMDNRKFILNLIETVRSVSASKRK